MGEGVDWILLQTVMAQNCVCVLLRCTACLRRESRMIAFNVSEACLYQESPTFGESGSFYHITSVLYILSQAW